MNALIVGAGRIGLATGALLRSAGFGVAYFDIDPDVRGELGDAGERVVAGPSEESFDLIAVCVPTATVEGEMSTAALRQALSTCAAFLQPGAFTAVAVRSTLLPGTMAAVVVPRLTELATSSDWAACHWPSFSRERLAVEDEQAPRLVCIGSDGDERLRTVLDPIFASLGADPLWTDCATAELIKHGSNLFNATKISYFNALNAWASAAGVDGQKVANAVALAAEGAWNPSYGTSVGAPFGGACLPKDLEAFLGYLRSGELPFAGFVEAVKAVNDSFGRVL